MLLLIEILILYFVILLLHFSYASLYSLNYCECWKGSFYNVVNYGKDSYVCFSIKCLFIVTIVCAHEVLQTNLFPQAFNFGDFHKINL